MRLASFTMSDFELRDLGSGKFELYGEMSFHTADRILDASRNPFAGHDDVRIDFAGVSDADSAGLALLLEWKSWAKSRQSSVQFVSLPQSILSIARTTDVDHLL